MQKLYIGSTNQNKVLAVQELIEEYPVLYGTEIISKKVSSDVSDQPLSLEETVRGAMNRAKYAYEEGGLGLGLESGLMQVPHCKTGYLNITACIIYNGKECFTGISSAFESPKNATELMVHNGLDMNQAYFNAGITEEENVGAGEGAIGLLTKGRINRKLYTKEAVRMAFIHLENEM